MHLVRRDLGWPDDALVVVMRLDDRLHRAADPDAVATADERLPRSVLGEERRVHLVRVVGPVREDVPHLDAALDLQAALLALGTEIAGADVVRVDGFALEVSARDDVS